MTALTDIASKFALEGRIKEIKAYGDGLINDTYRVTTEGNAPDYLLQRKNHAVFPDVPAMMDNIVAVTAHIKSKVKDPMRQSLTVIDTLDGRHCYNDPDGNWWAVCVFIDGTMSYNEATSPALAALGGKGIGRFQSYLADFDKPLVETIKGFHDIRWRFRQWDESIASDRAGRVCETGLEIEWIESRRDAMMSFWKLVEDGIIPRRVCHNDTKINNILFDRNSGDVLCVIDLDTVMSSTSLNDTGDALRTYTNTGKEDDRNLSNVGMDFRMFSAYIDGYLAERSDTLTESELENLAFSGLYLTYEQTLRFLMDYIDGDSYYKISYPDHNLVRARAQHKLLKSMESLYDEMLDYVMHWSKSF